MARFYLVLWLKWLTRISICSVLSALTLSFAITAIIYFNQNMPTLTPKVSEALFEILRFWFPLLWSLTLLVALFRSLKYIFNSCSGDYKFELLSCDSKAVIEIVGYGDLVKVWRRWFLLLIWLVGAQMVFTTAFSYVFAEKEGVFSWFNIYWLYTFVLSAGYFSFVLLANRCKRVKVKRC